MKQKEILATQEQTTDETDGNYSLSEREKIEGTPFTLIRDTNKQWFMVMGDYRVTNTTETKEEQIEKLETEKWLLIMHIVIVAIQKIKSELNH